MADNTSTVRLTDLEVIQQFSLAVRGATASRAEVIAALESDLAFLTATKSSAPKPTPAAKAEPEAKPEPRAEAPAKKAAAKKVPAKKATRTRGA